MTEAEYQRSTGLRRCACCGEIFNKYTPTWKWKWGGRLCCSYHCYSAMWRAANGKEASGSGADQYVRAETRGGHQNPITDAERKKILTMWHQGKPRWVIAEAIGRSRSAVDKAILRARREAEGAATAVRTSPRKTSEETRARIIEMYTQGMSQVRIAKELHCSTSTTSKILAEAFAAGGI